MSADDRAARIAAIQEFWGRPWFIGASSRADDDIAFLLAEVQRLRAIEGAAKALESPTWGDDQGYTCCTQCYCVVTTHSHAPLCPWLTLQRALGAEGA